MIKLKNEEMNKGDIVKGKKTNHPIIFINRESEDKFRGIILTHATAKNYPDNIAFRPEHFLEKDKAGNRFETQYDDSYFVKVGILKKDDWGPFRQTGKLSPEGLEHVERKISDLEELDWDAYQLL
jgi:hypothetical protein